MKTWINYAFLLVFVACGKSGGLNSEGPGGPGGDNSPPSVVDTMAPAIPGAFAAQAGGSTQVLLSWNAAGDDHTLPEQMSYEICQSDLPAGCNALSVAHTVQGIVFFTAGNLTPQTPYYFRIRAVDAAGNRGTASSVVSATTAAPGTSTSPQLTPANAVRNTPFTVRIAGTAPGESICYTTNGQNPLCTAGVCTTGTSSASAVDINVTTSRTIKARNCHASESPSPVISGVYTFDTQKPERPDLHTVTITGSNSLQLHWDAPADNHSSAATLRYDICMRTFATGCNDFVNPTTTSAPGATSHTFSGLTPNQRYYFRIRAIDQAGNRSDTSFPMQAQTPEENMLEPVAFEPHGIGQDFPPVGVQVQLRTVTAETIVCYGLDDTIPACNASKNGCASGVLGNAVQIAASTRLRATSCKAGMDSFPALTDQNYVLDTQAPTVPGSLISVTGEAGELQLRWNHATDALTPQGSITYEICRAGASGGCNIFVTSQSSVGNTFTFAGLAPGTIFYFRIRAKDRHGNTSGVTDEIPGLSGAEVTCSPDQPGWRHSVFFKSPYEDAPLGSGGLIVSNSFVATDGNTIAFGLPEESFSFRGIINGTGIPDSGESRLYSGAVHIYRENGGNWVREAYLKASNSGFFSYFGASVAIAGDTIAVGSPGEMNNFQGIIHGAPDTNSEDMFMAGAVYIFKRQGGTWSQQAYIKSSDADSLWEFGTSVSLSGETLVVGGNGKFYVFVRNPITEEWSEQTGIERQYARAVAISGDRIVVGSPLIEGGGNAGVYLRTGTNWALEATLLASNRNASDLFGTSVDISEDRIVIGAPMEQSNQNFVTNGGSASPDNSLMAAGAAYVFSRNAGVWTQSAFLKARNAGMYQRFGAAVALRDNRIVVGAPSESHSASRIVNGANTFPTDYFIPNSGAVHVFENIAGAWTNEAYIKSPYNNFNGSLGESVALSNNRIIASRSGDRNEAAEPLTTECGVPRVDGSNALGAAHLFVR